MVFPVLPAQTSVFEPHDNAVQQDKPEVNFLALRDAILKDAFFLAVHEVKRDTLDAVALTSSSVNKQVAHWRVNECLRDIAAGLVLEPPKALDGPAQGDAGAPSAPPAALGRQGSALRALRRLHRFVLGREAEPVELASVRQKPGAPSTQLQVHMDNLSAVAKARLKAADGPTSLPAADPRYALAEKAFVELIEHVLVPLRTWAFADADPAELLRNVDVAQAVVQDLNKNVTEFRLENKALLGLPPFANYYSDLRTALFWGNRFVKVPEQVLLFDGLEELDLSNTKLLELPEELARLQQLRELRLSHNKLSTLGPVVFELNSLQVLKLTHNAIVDVAPGRTFAPSLKDVSVDNESLSALGPALSGASGLESAFVQVSPQGKHVSAAIGALAHVPTLRLWVAKATALPPEMGKLKGLKKLHVVGSALRHLPEEMGELQDLERMSLVSDALAELPQSLEKCQNLQRLDLRMTAVTSRPPQALKMPKLTQLLGNWDKKA